MNRRGFLRRAIESTGGIVTAPTILSVVEGEPETFTPLPSIPQEPTITIHISGPTSREIAEQVSRSIMEAMQCGGINRRIP